jgi:hypothetical protein
MEYFGLSIREGATDDRQIVSLLMVKTLDKFIFDNRNPTFEMIRPFAYSSSGPDRSALMELFRFRYWIRKMCGLRPCMRVPDA